MDASTIVSLVGSLGFPVAACIYMAGYVRKQVDVYRADIKDLQQAHKDEIGKVTEALDNNTKALTELSIYIKEGVDKHAEL